MIEKITTGLLCVGGIPLAAYPAAVVFGFIGMKVVMKKNSVMVLMVFLTSCCIQCCADDNESETGHADSYNCLEFCAMHNNALEIVSNNLSECSLTVNGFDCETTCRENCGTSLAVDGWIAESCVEETEVIDCFNINEITDFIGSDLPNCERAYMKQLECSFENNNLQ